MLDTDTKFLMNLSLVLGHTLLLERKDPALKHFQPGFPRNGGDPPAPDPYATANANYASLAQNLPTLISETNAGAVPTAQSNLAAAQATTPQYSQLGLDTLKQFLPQYANVGN